MGAMSSKPLVLTIGHSTHSIERFLELLQQHGVTAVADVRSVPYSRFQPQFNRETLRAILKQHGIAYVFLGKELGARSDDESCYEHGRVQYRRLAQTPVFRAGIERVRKGSEQHRIALMCAEREPLECHRTLLVARELVAEGLEVVHIHADGRLESHDDAVTRLLQLVGTGPQTSFLQTRDELIDEAYSAQERRIAYVDKRLVREEDEVNQ